MAHVFTSSTAFVITLNMLCSAANTGFVFGARGQTPKVQEWSLSVRWMWVGGCLLIADCWSFLLLQPQANPRNDLVYTPTGMFWLLCLWERQRTDTHRSWDGWVSGFFLACQTPDTYLQSYFVLIQWTFLYQWTRYQIKFNVETG